MALGDAAAHGVGAATEHDAALDQLLDPDPAPVSALGGQRTLERFRRHVAGRKEHQLGLLGQEDVEQCLDVLARLVDRLLVGVGDIDRRRPPDAIGAGLIAVAALRDFAIKIEIARDRFHRAVALQVDVFAVGMGGPFQGLDASHGGAPDRRMRLLVGPRPQVHIFEVIVLALERERPRLAPRPHHQVVSLLVALQRMDRIGPERKVFGADAAHEAADQPPAGDDVEHGVLLGKRERVLAQAERVAQNGDAASPRAARQRGRHHHRGGHQSIGVLMVFVDADAVEAELGAELELVEIAVVERMSLARVVVAVGQHDPDAAVLVLHREIELGIGHQMKAHDPHGGAPFNRAGSPAWPRPRRRAVPHAADGRHRQSWSGWIAGSGAGTPRHRRAE